MVQHAWEFLLRNLAINFGWVKVIDLRHNLHVTKWAYASILQHRLEDVSRLLLRWQIDHFVYSSECIWYGASHHWHLVATSNQIVSVFESVH